MIIFAINYVLVCMMPEMAMVFGFTKWNRCLMSGLPTDSPLLGVVRMKLFEVNDLNCVEINRLMHELVVLT